QGLLDDILRIVHQSLTQPETMAMVREKIRSELPTLLRLYRADKYLVNKIVATATAFFEEVRSDPSHPFRDEFNRMVLSFVDQLKAWDMRQLISLIEINIGRDLQYIRFNGSLIGGLAGLALYTAEVLLRLL